MTGVWQLAFNFLSKEILSVSVTSLLGISVGIKNFE
jgi:hypothetical protein